MAVTWAFKRQIFYLGILILFIGVFGFLIIYPGFNQEPTCSDGKRNGAETGVDCGGLCARACTEEVKPLSVLWSRSFRVVPGRYNAVAYIENPNKTATVSKINYSFRFADASNLYIGKREGSAYFPAAGRYAIFEPAIDTGNSTPVYTAFEWTSAPEWLQIPPDKVDKVKILTSNIVLTGEETLPRLTATLRNNSLFAIPEITVIAILYDERGNAVGASRTYLEEIPGERSKEVSFTWPERFGSPVVAKEIIPIFDLFRVRIK